MRLRAAAAVLLMSTTLPAYAQQSFKDVPPPDPAAPAIEYVKEKGIFRGYDDGTFRPSLPVKRSEAAKILVLMKFSEQEAAKYTESSFVDVPAGSWYLPYVEAALVRLRIIDGPPLREAFYPDNSVKKAQFFKMLFKTQGADTAAFDNIKLPLAPDATDTAAWYYPLLRYALSSSVLQTEADGTLRPDAELSRADVATAIFRLAKYREGMRTQALLSDAEKEFRAIPGLLGGKDIVAAEHGSARALIAARGAHLMKPGAAIVQSAVKTAEAFRALVRAYRAGVDAQWDLVVTLSQEAWTLAEKAKSISPGVQELTDQVQSAAKRLADQAREAQKTQP